MVPNMLGSVVNEELHTGHTLCGTERKEGGIEGGREGGKEGGREKRTEGNSTQEVMYM